MNPDTYAPKPARGKKEEPWLQAILAWPFSKVIMILVAFAICGLLAWISSGQVGQSLGDRYKYPGATYEMIAGTEVVWEKPAGAKGVLLVFHGCNHGAIDFWHSSASCPKCTGLPEEMIITQTALKRGYMVVAISSQERTGSRCWNLPGMEGVVHGQSDIDKVKAVLEKLLTRERVTHLPFFAMGASSGGGFVLALASRWPFNGICSQIMGLPKEFMEELMKDETLLEYPPTMLVHMPRDERTHALVEETRAVLKKSGVLTREIQVPAAPLTPTTLSDVIASTDISVEQSKAIFTALSDGGLLDADGFLTANPRKSPWRKVIHDAGVPHVDLIRLAPDLSPVSEVLNRLYAKHEITSTTTTEMLDWFEERAKSADA